MATTTLIWLSRVPRLAAGRRRRLSSDASPTRGGRAITTVTSKFHNFHSWIVNDEPRGGWNVSRNCEASKSSSHKPLRASILNSLINSFTALFEKRATTWTLRERLLRRAIGNFQLSLTIRGNEKYESGRRSHRDLICHQQIAVHPLDLVTGHQLFLPRQIILQVN